MTQQSERPPYEITSGEDMPLQAEESSHENDSQLPKEKKAEGGPLELRRFSLGSSMLGWCLFLMFLCIVLSFWFPQNELLKNGFEAFKLIVMTILGYIFGSNSNKE